MAPSVRLCRWLHSGQVTLRASEAGSKFLQVRRSVSCLLKRCIPTAGKQLDDGESSEAAVDVTFEDAALALIAGSVEAVAAVRSDGRQRRSDV